MDRELKIELINLYEKLLTHKLPTKTANESTRDAIQKEFTVWVESRLEFLLNGKEIAPGDAPQAASQFSEEELQILRGVIDNIKSRQPGGKPAGRRGPVAPVSQPNPVASPEEAGINNQILKQLKQSGMADLAALQDDPNLPQY